ncbi:MAG TPA: SDR family NAD(P)-dependent oxidoreductase [Limnobacter sp.]|nr:SDR family NAD(P)-dependent oxidoreductase [Limnobacter sp.]
MTRNSRLSPCAIVVGVGAEDGVGGALCRRFADAGLPVFGAGRTVQKMEALEQHFQSEDLNYRSVVTDICHPESVETLFAKVKETGHFPEIVVFNASEKNMPKPLRSVTPEMAEHMWRVCCQGGFIVAQHAIEAMLPHKSGTLIFTGATASLRGRPQFAAFAAAKAGLRSFAQSFARQYGPKGIHVAHVILDGVVSGDRASSALGGIGKAYLISKGVNGTLEPAAVADVYWHLHQQSPSTWTHELDLRPFKESF